MLSKSKCYVGYDEDFCKDFYVTKSSGKEGKARGPKISGSSSSQPT